MLVETGYADWDDVVLRKLVPLVDYHSIHSMLPIHSRSSFVIDVVLVYTVSQGKHAVNVMGRKYHSHLPRQTLIYIPYSRSGGESY